MDTHAYTATRVSTSKKCPLCRTGEPTHQFEYISDRAARIRFIVRLCADCNSALHHYFPELAQRLRISSLRDLREHEGFNVFLLSKSVSPRTTWQSYLSQSEPE